MRGLRAFVAAVGLALALTTAVEASECYYYDYFIDISETLGIYGAIAEYSSLCPAQHAQAMMSFETWLFHNPDASNDTMNLWWELHFITAANGY